jgi:hypothetical protein
MEPALFLCVSSIGVFAIFLLIFGFAAYLRYMRYKETLALAEKGLVRPQKNGNGASNGKGALRWGIVITALGVAMCIGLYPFGWLAGGTSFPLNFGPWMVIGLIPTFFGLALILIYVATSKNGSPEPTEETILVSPMTPLVEDDAPEVTDENPEEAK